MRIDNDPAFKSVPHTRVEDVLDIPRCFLSGLFDVVLASPPCETFSMGSIRHHYRALATCEKDHGPMLRVPGEKWIHTDCPKPRVMKGSLNLTPKSKKARIALRLVCKTLEITRDAEPRWYWIENPVGGLKHFLPEDLPSTIVSYCRYGDVAMKPTRLWGSWPDAWTPRERCTRGNPDHEEARRGAKTGTQGKKGALRALVPYELSLEVCLACEDSHD